jgi:hypothetical protein
MMTWHCQTSPTTANADDLCYVTNHGQPQEQQHGTTAMSSIPTANPNDNHGRPPLSLQMQAGVLDLFYMTTATSPSVAPNASRGKVLVIVLLVLLIHIIIIYKLM